MYETAFEELLARVAQIQSEINRYEAMCQTHEAEAASAQAKADALKVIHAQWQWINATVDAAVRPQ